MTMDLDDQAREPSPQGPSTPALQALLWAHRGEWEKAHRLVQDENSAEAAWVHAWLHRVEGDEANATYWYRRAGRPAGTGSPSDEWRIIAAALRRSESGSGT